MLNDIAELTELTEAAKAVRKEKYARQKNLIKTYRLRKSINYQKWSVWTVGLEYSFMVMYTVYRDLLRSWKLRFNDNLNHEGFKILAGLRLYSCITGFDNMNIRMFSKFMVANRILAKEYLTKTYAMRKIWRLMFAGFVEGTDGKKWPKNVALTVRARSLFREFDIAVRKFFDEPPIVPKEMHGKWQKATPVNTDRFRVKILKDGKLFTKYCDRIETAKLLSEQATKDGIDPTIYKKVKKKGRYGRHLKQITYIKYEDKKTDRESIAGAA